MATPPKPGTPAFGQRARQRGGSSASEIQSNRKNDLRVQTAYKTVKSATAAKKKVLQDADED